MDDFLYILDNKYDESSLDLGIIYIRLFNNEKLSNRYIVEEILEDNQSERIRNLWKYLKNDDLKDVFEEYFYQELLDVIQEKSNEDKHFMALLMKKFSDTDIIHLLSDYLKRDIENPNLTEDDAGGPDYVTIKQILYTIKDKMIFTIRRSIKMLNLSGLNANYQYMDILEQTVDYFVFNPEKLKEYPLE